MQRILTLAIAALLVTPLAAQQDPAIGSSIEDVVHGEHWFGPKLDAKALKGKVVLLEMWGS